MLRRYSFAPMEQVISVSHVIVHENYEPHTMKNDLAVMKLKRPASYGQWVRPTCLPVVGRSSREGPWGPAPGTRCIAVGWGAIKEHGRDRKNYILKVFYNNFSFSGSIARGGNPDFGQMQAPRRHRGARNLRRTSPRW